MYYIYVHVYIYLSTEYSVDDKVPTMFTLNLKVFFRVTVNFFG